MRKIIFALMVILIFYLAFQISYKNSIISKYENTVNVGANHVIEKNIIQIEPQAEKEIDDWRLILVNYENILPENYEIELASIDNTRQFDSRAIIELNRMMKDMKKSGISNVWIQSAYRSIEYQTGLFNDKINTYMKQGKTREEAEELTLQTINKPGTSEHNLGLSVDFNYVNYSFDETIGFKWLQENAENYGFILRYRKEKEDITKVNYEPWHWRYVGTENAKKMNELDMCLEEYIEYLKWN